MEKLEERIGYVFADKSLLVTALTHSSYANEHWRENAESYERLEFLGDSILGLVTAEYLFSHLPPLPEGRMTRLRAELVCEANLHRTALRLGLGSSMRLGRGEELSNGRERPSILADMVEAIIAALYLDSGLQQARAFILQQILDEVELDDSHRVLDYKTELQELIQSRSGQTVAYQSAGESGPDHDKRFTFRVLINGVYAGEGSGRTKKEAEQMAAREALEALKK